jgi:radical SAM superfamily enzyme with C-terminal helix-hairpin-helix motif
MHAFTPLKLLALFGLTFLSNVAMAQAGNNDSVLNPNLADESELAAVPGLNPEFAAAIIAARPLAGNLELDALLGDSLGDEEKAQLRAVLFLPINLNSASEGEVKLVPGIDRKMVHEFDEYKPYTSLEQFRREIGKYVDEVEVARFEQYVFIPMDLNSASSDAFGTIPGMSGRMVHEFEEYRPYTSIEQFRREMGKYIDENEVARLERYIFIE